MNSRRLSFALCLSVCCTLCARGAAHAAAAANAPALTARAEVPAAAAPVATANAESSAADAESLPDLPVVAATPLRFDAGWQSEAEEKAPQPARLSIEPATRPSDPGVSILQSMPFAGAARHMGASHFNTDDGSSVSAFAICYRLNRRSSVQVIPGDPAPVKIPVTSMANNMGVTVGMVLRLSKDR